MSQLADAFYDLGKFVLGFALVCLSPLIALIAMPIGVGVVLWRVGRAAIAWLATPPEAGA